MGNIDRRIAALPPEKLALLARRLGKKGTERGGSQIALTPRDDRPIPLSFAQQRLWFLDQLEPGNPFYNMPASFRLRGPYDVAAFTRSLNEIVRRHEALRTTFEAVDGQPVQVIAPSLHLDVPVVDLSGIDASEREAEAQRLTAEEGRQPFDLSRGPLLRAKLLRLAEADHLLLLTMHHIVSDGWSMGVLFNELSALYTAYSAGRPSPLPELPIQYADFAVWQRELLQGQMLEEHLEYWRRHLRGAPTLIELPTDRPRPPVQGFRGSTYAFRLPLSLQQAVQALSLQEQTTPFMTLLAAFSVLLSRYARQRDLVIGTPIANRTRAELEGLIGFFVNTLALRLDLDGSPSFRELLGRVREVTLGAYTHQDLPFERLVEELSPERSQSHSPVFQVTFILQNVPIEAEGGAESDSDGPPPVDTGTAKLDLILFMVETPRGLLGAFEYNTDLFDAGTIERMAAHFHVLLAAAIAQPDQRITELPLLPAEERHRLLVEWNATAAPSPRASSLHALFEQQVERSPEAPAVLFQRETLTYRELNTRANRLSHTLRSVGVGPEVRVGICVERSAETVVAVLAVLKAGGAYVPLDPAYPRERLAFMINDAALSVLVTQTSLVGRLPPHDGAARIELDALGEALSAQPGENPRNGVTADNLAYIIYTSGSTGQPKGVLVEHRGLCNLPAVQERLYGIKPGDRLVQFAPLSFDTSIFEMAVALLSGATLVMGTAEELLPGPALVRLLRERAVTVMSLAPSILSALPAEESATLPLRVLAMAGEACPAELVKRWAAPGRRLFNSYGPTEATIWASTAADVDLDVARAHTPPIGRPIANAQIYLLDEALQPVPIGVPGEVFIGGVGVARGYHRRPDLTAERFVPDPFGAMPGARLYRSGDLARWLPDGSLEFLRRMDNQVKVRGYRIETGEIEAVLDEHPAVEASAVVCHDDDDPTRKELVAYLVEDPAFAAQSDQRSDLLEQLHGEWRIIFDETFQEERPAAPAALDTVGWRSSYTGALLSAEEMQAWTEASVERILGLGPRRVLEVGCGTGLILLRVAPHVDRYVGTDFSPVVIEQLAAKVGELGVDKVRLARLDAAELATLDEQGFDVIVLNSVVQYFPSLDYLVGVLEQALPLLNDQGAIFLGDVRSLPQLAVQHASVQLHRAGPGASRAEVRAAMQRKIALEKELLVHPGFFTSLPARLRGLAGVEVQLRRGRHGDEMTRFRYDVVIRKGSPSRERIKPAVLDAAGWTAPLEALRRVLVEDAPDALVVENLPNRRVGDEVRTLEWIEGVGDEPTAGALRVALAERPLPGVHPEDVWRMGESLGYATSIAWSGSDPRSRFDVLLHRGKAGQAARVIDSWPRWPRDMGVGSLKLANDPVAGRWERALARSVRAHLERRLPAYMVPTSYVRLDALPLTPNGKIDRPALCAPGRPTSTLEQVAPRTDDERRLAKIWADALGLDSVGITSDFFELGGHSLLATQVISRIRDTFGINLALRRLFEARTVQALAKELRAPEPTTTSVLPLVRRTTALGTAPLSFAQQRLWFLDQFEPGSAFYNMHASLRFPAPYDVAAFTRSLNEIVRRHEALRTTFQVIDGQPMQVIAPSRHLDVPVVDLSGLDASKREAAAQRLATEEGRQPFDLSRGPLLRAKLLRLADADHLLLLTMHHIVSDGWSMGVLFKELSALYAAYSAGLPSPLAELPIQYADFAVWQREMLQGEALESDLGYWKQHLRGAPALLELPTDRPRPAVQVFRGSTYAFRLPLSLQQAVQALSRQEGATPFMTLLSAFGVLLHRYARQSDLVIGTPIANRTRAELEGLIGFFVNTLALRLDLDGSPSFRELLGRVREVTLGAYTHQDLPFERLVEELSPDRNLSHSPVIQVMFALQNMPGERAAGGAMVEADDESPAGPGTAKFDVTLSLMESPRGLLGAFEYNTDLFDAGTIERMAAHFHVLLAAAMAQPDQRITELPLLPAEERHRLLVEWNATAAPSPRASSLHALFEQQVERSPEAPAVLFQRETLTYRELNTRANRLAHFLRSVGVGPEVRVGICVERSAETVVAVLAVLKAGGAYVPLDPAYPRERLAFMINDAALSVLVTQTSLVGRLPPHDGAARIELDALDEALSAQPGENPRNGVAADNLAYIIYTSGSTGQPKGVLVEHRGLCNLPAVQERLYGIKPGDRLVQFAPLSFDTSIFEMAVALLSGATLVMGTAEELLPGPALVRLLRERAVTVMSLAPSVLSALPAEESATLPLRVLAMAGEACPAEPVKRWAAPGRRLFNSYGPTEATIWASTAADIDLDVTRARTPPIGRPIANAQIYLLDEALQPVPIGVPGEVFIGGVGVARGYHRRPDLTAERFVPDPFGAMPGARLYRSGDLARWLPDGSLEFLRRVDNQVKIRGHRIELEEIRAALLQHPSIDETAVVAREDTPGDKRLVAYVVSRNSGHVPTAELRASLGERLPAYMVPSAFVRLDALPLTPNGKVDHRALPVPEPAGGEEGHVAPRDAIEEEIAKIWADVLGVERVGVHDNFFDLGGHSLRLAKVHGRLGERLERPPSMVDLFTYPTVASLARFLGEQARGESEREGEPETRAGDIQRRARRRREAMAQRKQRSNGGNNE